jgi:mono/diheme cytochrome c family protein
MPNFHLSTREIEALTEYLLSLRPPEGQEVLIRQAALEPDGDPEAGGRVFREARCISCHTLEGRGLGNAPELSQVGSKASKGWLLAFMKDTHAIHPTTVMSAYRFSSTDLRNLVAYLTEELRDFDDTSEAGDDGPVREDLVGEGRDLYVKYGCGACHLQDPRSREDIAPDLIAVGDAKISSLDFGARRDLPRTLSAWLGAKVIEPRSFGPSLKMPSFALNEGELTDIITAMMAMSKEYVPEDFRPGALSTVGPAPRPPSGDVGRLFSKYRCLACHMIGNLGTDLSTAPLNFQGSKTKSDWLAEYLVLPYTIYPLLTERMPILGITPEEAKQMADYISAVYADDAIPASVPLLQGSALATAVTNGANVFRDKGCRSCHTVGDTGGYVGPPLSEAGDRLQSGWIAYWLENPQRWRREARCPNYGLNENEIRELTAFLSSLSTRGGSRQ